MTRNQLLLALIAGLMLLLAACGDDDDTQPVIGDGPAEDVSGAWQGTYTSVAGDRAGTFCWDLDQDGRSAQGEIAFDGGEPIDMAGLITEGRLQLVWGSRGADTSAAATTALAFAEGGTLSGDALGGGASGQYNSLDADRGDWTASRADGEACG